MTRPIRVLLVDDSRTARATLAAILAREPTLEVVGQAGDGEAAVRMAAALRPDVITMDLAMPGMGGIEAISQIMATTPCRILAVAAVERGLEAGVSFDAITAGALELIAKPSGPREGEERPGLPAMHELRAWGDKVVEAIRLMAEIPVVTRRDRPGQIPRSPARPQPSSRVRAIGIVASTGGPPALAEILAGLPGDFPVPILLAQHLMPGFSRGLIDWLSECTELPVEMAREGMLVRPGRVYLPPDQCDLEISGDGRALVPPTRGGPCPSGDRMLFALARHAGDRAVGVVLTGMGDDGAQGLLAVRRAGGITFAQDRESSIVYGMPDAAAKVGAVASVLPLGEIARALGEVSKVQDRECSRPQGPNEDIEHG